MKPFLKMLFCKHNDIILIKRKIVEFDGIKGIEISTYVCIDCGKEFEKEIDIYIDKKVRGTYDF